MRPTPAVRVEDPVAVDDFVVLVFEEWKIELTIEPFTEHFAEFFRIVVIVDADRKDLDLFFLWLRQ
jgi:hypothetical protein